MSLLNVQNLSFKMGGRQILQDISCQVEPGQVLALIGPNGAGKSTLLSLLAGDQKPSAGSISLAGRPLESYKPLELARTRAVLMQQTSVAFSYTAQQVVQMGRAPWRGHERSQQDQEVVARALEATDTVHLAQRDVRTLSGGEAGRVHLARVFAQQTPLLLLDEPTAALDILHQENTLKLAREYAQNGIGVVVVLHDLDLAASYANQLLLLEKGRVAAQGSPQQVCQPEVLSRVYRHPIEVLSHPVTGRPLILPQRG